MDTDAKKGIFYQLQESFQPEKSAGVNAAIQLKLSGEGSGNYFLRIENKTITGGEGSVEKPRITITADTKDLVDVFEGRLDAMSAYFQGRIMVQGDLGFAMTLAGLFKRSKK